MKKENKLILNLLRFSLDKKQKNKIKSLLKKEFDWNYILKTARWHGVSSILYKTLKNINFKNKFMQEFEEDYYSTCFRNSLSYKELERILKSFGKKNIDVILMKGIYLAKYVYKDIGLRPMEDIDMLVKKRDLFKINKTLRKIGYINKHSRNDYHNVYLHKQKNIHLEIHYNTHHKKEYFYIDQDIYFKNKKEIKNKRFYVLLSEYELLYLVMHLSRHVRNEKILLKWFFDLDIYIKKKKINFYEFRKIVEELRIENHIYLIFMIYKKYIDPKFDLNFITKPSLINKKIINYIFSRNLCSFFKQKHEKTKDIIDFILLKNNLQRIKMIYKYIFPSIDNLYESFSVRRKTPFIYLLYLLNPFRLLISFLIIIMQKDKK